MGRLSAEWAGRKITQRIPYTMSGELIRAGGLSGQVFPDATFTWAVDMPFEVHRIKPQVTGLTDANAVVAIQPAQETLLALVRAKIDRIGGTITLTKSPTLLRQLVKGSSEMTWEFAEPDTIVRQEGYSITVDTLAIPVFADPVARLRIEIAFQGFLLQLGPASEQR